MAILTTTRIVAIIPMRFMPQQPQCEPASTSAASYWGEAGRSAPLACPRAGLPTDAVSPNG